jgi:hypothetical protein
MAYLANDFLDNLTIELVKKKNNYQSNIVKYNNEILIDYLQKRKEVEAKNKINSHLFNPLKQLKIAETAHSYLLSNLLNPYGNHGQGNLFLKIFLEDLDIEVNQGDIWHVTAEIGRIDIMLKRKFPHTVIIIENKSNFAVDQESQLYRYWYQEIYKSTNNNTDIIKDKNYQILYLTPSELKIPNKNSLVRPEDYDKTLPEEIPIEPKILYFQTYVVNWLQKAILKLNLENYRLREYLKQYIELWTE